MEPLPLTPWSARGVRAAARADRHGKGVRGRKFCRYSPTRQETYVLGGDTWIAKKLVYMLGGYYRNMVGVIVS